MKSNIFLSVVLCIFGLTHLQAQKRISLRNMDAFRPNTGDWQVFEGVEADTAKVNNLTPKAAAGGVATILLCQHTSNKYGTEMDLLTKTEHGDIDISFDFMMAKGSNSGIYLQGLYEIQLFDSWGKKSITHSDCGGIYERWDEGRPKGTKGYQGVAPRTNAAKPPGQWQNMKISFKAPKFDNNGKKTTNAKIVYIVMNGVLIHENVELSGPTRGSLSENETAMGPLRFQGDHGNIAIRNIKY
jgi:Domain of Unknown Function (DUF1080)